MQTRCVRALMVGSVMLLLSVPAYGQFITLVTDFEGSFTYPANLPDSEVIFRDPSFSPSSTGLDPAVTDDTFLADKAGMGSFLEVVSGTQGVLTNWGWLDPSFHSSWVRLTTSNPVDIPNPALHLGGKVRFYLGGTAYTDNTFATEVAGGKLFLGIGVRETGLGVPLGADGATGGDIEWVGLSDKLAEILAGTNGFCDTTANPASDDVQVTPPGQPGGPDDVCVSAGTNGVLNTSPEVDDGTAITPVGMISVPLDRTMRLYEFDLPALEASGNVFSFSGDGALGATPNNRGTLEQLVLTNDPINATVSAKQMLVWIDDVEFEAPIPNPPVIVTIPDPPRPLDTNGVAVTNVDPTADLVELFIEGRGGDPDFFLGSVANPGTSNVTIPNSIPLPFGVFLYVQQTVSTVPSDKSMAVGVSSPGNGPLRLSLAVRETDQYDHNLGCGDNGTGYDPNQPSNLEWIGATGHASAWGTPEGGRRFKPEFGWRQVIFDPCTDPVAAFSGNGIIDIDTTGTTHTNGVWEGLYFRIDEIAPTTGPYTIYIDDLIAINAISNGVDCLIDDFESYTPGEHIIDGGNGVADTTANPASDDVQVLPFDGIFGEIIVSPGTNGILETTPQGDDFVSPIHARFNPPGVAGTSQGLAATPDRTEVTAEDAYSGTQSLKVQWAFVSASNENSHVRLTTNEALLPNPKVETFLNPDPVVPFSLDGTWCDGSGDIAYSVMIKLEPVPIMGDCDFDGDIDLVDFGCFQECFGPGPLSSECDTTFDYYDDDAVDLDDYVLFQLSLTGPQ